MKVVNGELDFRFNFVVLDECNVLFDCHEGRELVIDRTSTHNIYPKDSFCFRLTLNQKFLLKVQRLIPHNVFQMPQKMFHTNNVLTEIVKLTDSNCILASSLG